MKRIYDCIKSALEQTEGFRFNIEEDVNQYRVSFQTIDVTTPESIGLWLEGSANDLEDMAGNTLLEYIKLHVQIQTGPSEESIFHALNFLRTACEKLESIKGEQAEGLYIKKIKRMGPKSVIIGSNDTGSIAVANYSIMYTLH